MGLYGKYKASVDFERTSEVMQPVTNSTFNGYIEIIDPKIADGTYDRVTNKKDRGEPEVLWEGRARIQAVRWPNVATTRQEAISIRTVIFHIPLDEDIDPGLIQEGYRVHVIDGGMSPQFEHGLFVITATTNTSYAWDRRIETMMDQGASIE